jgi:hypothetical protein
MPPPVKGGLDEQLVGVAMVAEGVSEYSVWLSQTKSDPPSTFTSAPVM